LKNLFVEFYDSLCPVKMSNRCMKKLIAHSSGKIVPKEDLEMYKKELDIDIEVVENISIPVYCTISGTDLDKLIK